MHFISDIPEPAAYGANDLTKHAEVKANSTYYPSISHSYPDSTELAGWAYGKEEVYDIVRNPEGGPMFPFRAT